MSSHTGSLASDPAELARMVLALRAENADLPETGDIIARIRDISEPRAALDQTDVIAVAKAVVAIRAYFMPRRAKSCI